MSVKEKKKKKSNHNGTWHNTVISKYATSVMFDAETSLAVLELVIKYSTVSTNKDKNTVDNSL